MHTISARLRHPQAGLQYRDCYCFDAEEHSLIAEPFVPSATAAIAAACASLNPLQEGGIPAPPPEVDLRFTASSLEDLNPEESSTTSVWVVLNLLCPEGDGHNYDMLVLEPGDAVIQYCICYSTMQLWLCPVLLDYFPNGAPQRLFVQITPRGTHGAAPNPNAD